MKEFKLSIALSTLKKMRAKKWTPSIKKFVPVNLSQINNEYQRLEEHHQKETKILLDKIAILSGDLLALIEPDPEEFRAHIPDEDGESCKVCYVDLKQAVREDGLHCTGCNCDHDCRFDRYHHDDSCEHYDECRLSK